VRNRIKRGTLRAEREAGRVYVLLSEPDSRDKREGESELVAVLREQLAAERRAHAEARRIIAGLVERIPAIEAPEDAETVEEAPDRAEPRSAMGEAQDELGAERARRETAESTLHEGMAEERRRREAAERERDELRRELFARSEPGESPETVVEERREVEPTSYAVEVRGPREVTEAHEAAEEQQGRGGSPRSATGGAQEGAQTLAGRASGTARGSLWRRLFGR
jgi:hypothetical protein